MLDLFDRLIAAKIPFKENLSGKELSAYRGGGAVKIVAYPESVSALKALTALATEFGVPYIPFGLGSNLLISDNGYDGIFISSIGFRNLSVRGNRLVSGSGVSLKRAMECAAENDVSGLEELSGIPASIGGMAKANAGSFGKEMADIISEVTVFDCQTGNVSVIKRRDIDYGYRTSGDTFRGKIILEAVIDGEHSDKVRKVSEHFLNERRKTQPSFPSLGSVFKRTNLGVGMGYYIDKAGLKGTRVGGAEISEKHAGFIVNRGGGTAADYIKLKRLAHDVVYRKFGISAEDEIEIIGKYD